MREKAKGLSTAYLSWQMRMLAEGGVFA